MSRVFFWIDLTTHSVWSFLTKLFCSIQKSCLTRFDLIGVLSWLLPTLGSCKVGAGHAFIQKCERMRTQTEGMHCQGTGWAIHKDCVKKWTVFNKIGSYCLSNAFLLIPLCVYLRWTRDYTQSVRFSSRMM